MQNYIYNFIDNQIKNDLLADLIQMDFENLVDKYSLKSLLEKIFSKNQQYQSFFDTIDSQRHFFLIHFWPGEKIVTLTPDQRSQIINYLATLKPETTDREVQISLSKIDPNLVFPPNTDKIAIQKKAYQFYRVYNIFDNLLLETFAKDYLPDTLFCYKKTKEELESISQRIALLTEDFKKEFTRMAKEKTDKADQQVIEKAIDLLKITGRSQFFLKSEKEKADLGFLAELFVKLNVAIQAAISLKQVNTTNQNINVLALEEIKKVLKPGIQL